MEGSQAAQRAIHAVQRQLERLVIAGAQVAVTLCDRGTVDGLAYWPDDPDTFFDAMTTTRDVELARYATVIHLDVPSGDEGYHTDSIRTESAERAAAIDRAIAAAWGGHPAVVQIRAGVDFAQNAHTALEAIRAELPTCCHGHDFVTPSLT